MASRDLTIQEGLVEREEGLLVEHSRITEVAIANIKHNILMAEKLVVEVLEKDVDWGHVSGIQGDMLFDPGAQKVFAAFNAFPKHEILFERQDEDVISFVIQSNAVGKGEGNVLSQGVGAASTREVKYKYRWEEYPAEYGYSPEEIKTLKVKKSKFDNSVKYQIKNPEYGDLVNTILTMAAKRADVDCARGLPGVGTALKKLFDPKLKRKEIDWAGFWGEVAKMGLDEANVREILQIKSLNEDWVMKGKTLDQAKKTLIAHLQKNKKPKPAPEGWETKPETSTSTAPIGEAPASPKSEGEKVPTNVGELIQMAIDLGVSKKELFDQLNVKSPDQIKDVPKAWAVAKQFGEFLKKQ